MKILHLTVTKEWFNKILSKTKQEDFREIKSYWNTRLIQSEYLFGCQNALKPINETIKIKEYDLIKIVNGYGKTKPTILAKFDGVRITKEDEKTDLGIGCFYAIKIGDFIEIKNTKGLK